MYNHKLSFPSQNKKTTANQVFTFLIMSPQGKLGLVVECEAFVMYMNFASFAIHLSFGLQTLQWRAFFKGSPSTNFVTHNSLGMLLFGISASW